MYVLLTVFQQSSTRTNLSSPAISLCYNFVDATERTVRNAAEKQWNDALTGYRAPYGSYGSWNVTHSQGCQLRGHIYVDKAPGKFLLHAQSYGHDIAANMANLSHIVHHFSFGDGDTQSNGDGQRLQGMQSGFVKSLHPMDGNVYVTDELHQAYHHHLRVIAIEFGEGKAFMWAREQYRRFYRILHNSQLSTYRRHILPGEKYALCFHYLCEFAQFRHSLL
jgi:hypothetical protein